MGSSTARAVVLDAGALIALERHDRRIVALLQEASGVVVPAGVVAQVWRGSGRQARTARLLRAAETVIEPLDADVARVVGILCGDRGSTDVIDASVAVAALQRGAVVVTSDPAEIERLAPSLHLHRC